MITIATFALALMFIIAASCENRKHSNPLDPYYVGDEVIGAPVAAFTVTPDTGYVNLTVFICDASASIDAKDSTNLAVRWDWENDGTWDTNFSTFKTATHQYATVGDKTIKLEVMDSDTLSGTTTQQVTVLAAQSGTVSGVVQDPISNGPLADVNVQAFLPGGTTPVAQTMTQSNGSYQMTLPAGAVYSLKFAKAGLIDITYNNITVDPGQTLPLESIYQLSTAYSGQGTVGGTIWNALDGAGIPNVTLKLRAGINVFTGNVEATTTTNASGEFQVNLNGGNYTAEASNANFSTTYFSILSVGGQTRSNQNTSMSPPLNEGEIRVVLTWGDDPNDLDSHMTGPLTGSAERFHVYYSEKGDRDQSPFTFLDHDDTNEYGPETITIAQQFDGVYRYSVHDFSNRYADANNPSQALSASRAKVSVYSGADLIKSYNVPSNVGATLWTVFELNGETLVSINTMTYVTDPEAVNSIGKNGSGIDPVFRNFRFPEK